MVKHVLFPNLQGTTILLFFFVFFFFKFKCFNLGLRTISSVYTQKVDLSNVCVLLCKYNAYGEQLLVYC